MAGTKTWSDQDIERLNAEVAKAKAEKRSNKSAFEIIAKERGTSVNAVSAKWATVKPVATKRKAKSSVATTKRQAEPTAPSMRNMQALIRELPSSDLFKLHQQCNDEIARRQGTMAETLRTLAKALG